MWAETIEGLAPFAYGICFAIEFYGPNARIVGNVKNGYWQYKEVEDINWLFIVLFLMFIIDTISVLINALIVWRFCKVNILQEFSKTIEKYWLIIILKLALEICMFFLSNDINVGTDFTTHFNWITREGRYKLLINTTDLSDVEHIALSFN